MIEFRINAESPEDLKEQVKRLFNLEAASPLPGTAGYAGARALAVHASAASLVVDENDNGQVAAGYAIVNPPVVHPPMSGGPYDRAFAPALDDLPPTEEAAPVDEAKPRRGRPPKPKTEDVAADEPIADAPVAGEAEILPPEDDLLGAPTPAAAPQPDPEIVKATATLEECRALMMSIAKLGNASLQSQLQQLMMEKFGARSLNTLDAAHIPAAYTLFHDFYQKHAK